MDSCTDGGHVNSVDELGFTFSAAVDSSQNSMNCDIILEASDDGLFVCPSFNSYTESVVESASRAASQLDSSPEFLGFDDSFEFSMLRSSITSDYVLKFPLFDRNSAIEAYRNPSSSFFSSDSSMKHCNSSNSAIDSIRNPNSSFFSSDSSMKHCNSSNFAIDSIGNLNSSFFSSDSSMKHCTSLNPQIDSIRNPNSSFPSSDSSMNHCNSSNSEIDSIRNPNSSIPSSDSSTNHCNSTNPKIDSIRNPNSSIRATDSTSNSNKKPKREDEELASIRVTLKKLIYSNQSTDQSPSSSSSSSESEGDLEELAKGPYCEWKPRTSISTESSRDQCRKSKSTGSPCKQWILSGLLSRSCSDGSKNRTNVMVTRATGGEEGRRRSMGVERSPENKSRGGEKGNMSPHEVMYVLNRAKTEEKKKMSFLPYKPTLVGFFSKVR